MPRKGETPGKGKYTCLYCGHEVIIEDDEQVLSGCPMCQNAVYY